jgi:hypothetical protein
VTKVIKRIPVVLLIGLYLAANLFLTTAVFSQENTPAQKPAETLYLRLRNVGLDKSRVYHIREATLDRSSIHITLDDGTIGFTEDVAGHITGAFFDGDGEVLLTPPNRAERASMALFTGAAILEERFSTAYFRFDDNTFAELQPKFRPADNTQEFFQQWSEAARNLAPMDALPLFMNLSKFLPSEEKPPPLEKTSSNVLWHARVQGKRVGTFDLYYDSEADEQISVGQSKIADGANYFDIWTSFAPPDHKKSETEDFDISSYKIKATIAPPTQLNAEAWLQLDAQKDCQRALLFELSRYLQVKAVDVDGHPVEFIHNQALEGTELARVGNDQIAVVLPASLHSGNQAKLHFVYGGEVLSDAGGGLVYVGARGDWYPNRRPAMSNFDLEFHSPPGWTLIATGKRVDEKIANNGDEQITHWVSERPLPVAGFNLGRYERAVSHAGNVLVETYASKEVEKAFPTPKPNAVTTIPFLPGGRPQPRVIEIIPSPPLSPARNAQAVADNAAQAINFFSRAFGPYPYSSLSMTQKPGTVSQGWPGLVFLSSLSFLNEGEKSRFDMGKIVRTMTDAVVAHETAHQWWGDLVNWDGYRDQWVIEALADYSSLMLLETQDPGRFHAVLENYRSNLLQKNKDGEPLMSAGPVTLGNRLSSSHFPNGYEVISYERGVWLLHMLRHMLLDGERKTGTSARMPSLANDPFMRTLRRVRSKYEGRTINTRELVQAFEEDLPRPLWHEGHKSLEWFYDGWLNGTAIPRLELDDIKFEAKTSTSIVVTGKITQKNAPDSLITLVPIYAVGSGKNVFIGQVFVDEEENHFHLTAPAGTRRVVLDPNHTLLIREK